MSAATDSTTASASSIAAGSRTSHSGIVFDIQRCSLHDGPGIRTAVFLKGCPLRCSWCHNPESQDLEPQLLFFTGKCRLCGACVAACPHGLHRVADGEHTIDHGRCIACGKCAEACLYEALRVSGSTMTVDQVMAEVEKDRAYYEASGGGITLTGGEPLMQFGFARAILEAARSRSVHTCVETSGFTTSERMRDIAPLVDLFLFDYKVTGPTLHRELTGVEHSVIADNLDLLCSAGRPVVLRCPMVPGVNDSDEHLRAIAELSKRYTAIRGVEIMAYHDLAADKYARIGRTYSLGDVENPQEAVKAAWLQSLERMGCRNASIG